jgi:homoserine acetyltransferase
VAKDFKFHTGETLPALKIAYTTVGDPSCCRVRRLLVSRLAVALHSG